MEIKLGLALPREELSVPVVRRVLKASLDALGVERVVIHDIEVALTEAVTNVLDHATHGEEYEVSAGIDGDICVIEIIDRGAGFQADDLGHDNADPTAEDRTRLATTHGGSEITPRSSSRPRTSR